MKKKSIIGLFALLTGFGAATTSCEDMLTPDMDRYADGFTGRDTVNFYFGILSNLQDVIENNVILGEVRSDMVVPTDFVSDSLSRLSAFEQVPDGDNEILNRSAYYKVINQCNFYLAKVDTMAMKNNIYYMRREFAQVQMVRAWTYMQLVQNYGEVPFLVDPVDNANTGWETTPPEGFVDADNLLDKLMEHGLNQAYLYEKTLGYPNYGSFNTGAVNIPHSQVVFPGDLVLADLYLLRGHDKMDYEKAAAHYYKYIDDNNLYVQGNWRANTFKTFVDGKEVYRPAATSWASAVTSYDRGNGIITLVPSAANSSLGKVLTRVQQIYGFDPKSSSHTSAGDKNESVVSGNISITANYKNRQLEPSMGYLAMNKAQLVSIPEMSGGVQTSVTYPQDLGDCRIDGSFKYVQTLDGRLPFVQKFGARNSNLEHSLTNFNFRYGLSVYRVTQIFLRYAEAINRAGYPRHAFAVLRNGLSAKNNPEMRYDSIVYDDVNKIKYAGVPYADVKADGNNCIDKYELYQSATASVDGISYLDFSEHDFYGTGIHELGNGSFTDMDTLYTYDLKVLGLGYDELKKIPEGFVKEDFMGRIQQEEARVKGMPMPAFAAALKDKAEEGEDGEENEPDRTGYTVVNVRDYWETGELPDSLKDNEELISHLDQNLLSLPKAPENLQEQINAVETLIAEEMALETSFEGWRYYDLYRIARHKNKDAADYGTQWFAWLVSRRNLDLKPYEQPATTDGALYGKLLDMQNWYLKNPVYKK